MRALALLGLFACSTPAPRAPTHERCTLRVTDRALFVDGERMARDAAIAYCKRAPGGAVVLLEGRDLAWDATRHALEHEGVRVYVRGPLCSLPRRDACQPIILSPQQPRRELVVQPPLVTPLQQ